MSRLRLALLGPLPPPYGGVAVHLESLIAALRARGVRVRVLASSGSPSADDAVRLSYTRLGWAMSLVRILAACRPGGLLHNHSSLTMYPEPHLLGRLLRLVRIARIRWIESVHDGTIVERHAHFSTVQKQLFLQAMRESVTVLAMSEPIRDFLLELGVDREKIRLSRPLLPTPHMLPQGYAGPADEYWSTHDPVWLASGSFTPLYDFATIVRAFLEFRATSPRAGLILVGARFSTDGRYEAQVRSLAGQASEDVLLLEDVSRAVFDGLLSRADLFVRGAQRESFGLSKVEALMAGTPVVTTDAGETRHMSVYEHGNVDSLLGAVGRAVVQDATELSSTAQDYARLADEEFAALLDLYVSQARW